MVSLLTKLGFASFSTLFNPNDPPVQEVLSSEDANSKVSPTIDTTIESQPYNFILGTPGGANDPNAVADGAAATEPIDDGDPEYSMSEAQLFASMQPDASNNPSDLDRNVFSGWSQQEQQLYLSSWGVTQAVIGANVNGGANALYVSEDNLGNVSSASLYAVALAQANASDATDVGSSDPGTQTYFLDLFATENNQSPDAAQAGFMTPPADLDPSVFVSWTPQAQAVYLDFYDGGAPAQTVIGSNFGNGANAIVVQTASLSGTPVIASTTSLQSWALQQAAALNSSAQLTVPTSSSPSDLGAYGSVAPADLDPSVFNRWTSEQQSEYMNYNGLTTAVIGSAFDGGANALTAVLSQTKTATVYIVNNLQASNLAEMSTVDVQAVAATAEFQNVVGPELGLSSDVSAGTDIIDNAINAILGTDTTTTLNVTNLVPVTTFSTTFSGQLPQDGLTTQTASDGSSIFTSVVTNSDGSVTATRTNVGPNAGPAMVTMSTYTPNAGGTVTLVVSAWDGTGSFSTSAGAGSTNPPTAGGTTITGLSAPSALSTTTYTAAQVAAGVVAIPAVGATSTTDANGDVETDVVTSNGSATTKVATIIDPGTGAATLATSSYTANSDGSITVVSSSQTGTASTTTSGFGAIPSDGGLSVDTAFTSSGSATTTMETDSTGKINMSQVITANAVTVSTPGGEVTVNNMPAADRDVYVQELQLLEQQLDASGVVDQTQIQAKIGAVLQRFDQAALYWNASTATTSPQMSNGQSTGVTTGVASADGGASFAKTYQTFIAQEKLILQAAQDGESLATDASLQSPDIDAPTAAMIALTALMSSQQAQIEIGTTQLQQIQGLLQNISTLQNLINSAVTSLGSSTTDQTGVGGMTGAATGLSASDLAVVEMFSSNIAALGPIFKQYGITPPDMTLIKADGTLATYNQSQLNSMGTQLSTNVTELTQQLQQLTSTLNQQVQQENNIYTENSGIAGQMGTIIDTIGTNVA